MIWVVIMANILDELSSWLLFLKLSSWLYILYWFPTPRSIHFRFFSCFCCLLLISLPFQCCYLLAPLYVRFCCLRVFHSSSFFFIRTLLPSLAANMPCCFRAFLSRWLLFCFPQSGIGIWFSPEQLSSCHHGLSFWKFSSSPFSALRRPFFWLPIHFPDRLFLRPP